MIILSVCQHRGVMRGGKYISRGSYGCIFLPPVPCDADGSSRKGSGDEGVVGKIFKNASDAEEEERNHTEVQRVDPHGVFTVRLLSKCVNVPKHAVMGEMDATACSLLERRESFTQITYEHGGVDAYKMLSGMHEYPLESWARALESVFYGLCALERSGLVHRDLSAGNLLFDKRRGRFVMIDFGMQAHAADHFRRASDIFQHRYAWYPPEFKLMASDAPATFITLYERFKDNFGSDIRKLEAAYGSVFVKDLLGLFDRFRLKGGPREEFFGPVWNRTDIYSIGVTLLLLLAEVEKGGHYTSAGLLEGLKGVMLGMVRMDPVARSTPMKAFAAYHRVARAHLRPQYRGVLYAAATRKTKGLSRFTEAELRALCTLRGAVCLAQDGKRDILTRLASV